MLSLLATVLTFAAASQSVGESPMNNPPLLSTTAQLAAASGISRGFVIAAGFIGILIFILFTASIAGEYSQGTLRALLTRQPRRAPLLAGKFAALLVGIDARTRCGARRLGRTLVTARRHPRHLDRTLALLRRRSRDRSRIRKRPPDCRPVRRAGSVARPDRPLDRPGRRDRDRLADADRAHRPGRLGRRRTLVSGTRARRGHPQRDGRNRLQPRDRARPPLHDHPRRGRRRLFLRRDITT